MKKVVCILVAVLVLATNALAGKDCWKVTDPDKRALCEGATVRPKKTPQAGGSCWKIMDHDLRALCEGKCWKINDWDLRMSCRGMTDEEEPVDE